MLQLNKFASMFMGNVPTPFFFSTQMAGLLPACLPPLCSLFKIKAPLLMSDEIIQSKEKEGKKSIFFSHIGSWMHLCFSN